MMRERRADVCGVDEAGRGPWAGPVFAAAVILSPRRAILGLNDSKKLSARQRESLEPEIKARALAWGIGSASVEEIDSLNILRATGLAMYRAIEAMGARPALALVDGNYAFSLPCSVETVVKGDATHEVIAAASILAKTARDRVMVEMDARHPGYGFAAHKGYGVKAHAAALSARGPCAIHRVSFAPIRILLAARVDRDFQD